MERISRIVQSIDSFQQRHAVLGFPYAIIKKYGDDQAGYQAALVTYYGFLSLFPLLLVLTTVAGFVSAHDPALGHRLAASVSGYFPIIGQQLDSSVKGGLSKGGLTLVIGLLFTLYGARGVADAYRNAVNHIWHIPRARRSSFPRALARSGSLILGGGLGFILASIIAGWAATAGHGLLFRALSVVLNLGVLYVTFLFIMKASLPLQIGRDKFRVGAAISAIGLTILQQVGSYVVAHQASSLNGYGTVFATTLGLLAWIYLQTQVILYAVETDTIRATHLWPRSLTGKQPTKADVLAEREPDLSQTLLGNK